MTDVFTEAPTVGTNQPAPVAFNRETAPIYYYGGHGEDLCDSRTQLPIIRIVPENCIYITISECGYSTQIKGGEEDFFRSADSDAILRYPEVGANKATLSERMRQRPQWVHIHMPGTPYVAAILSPFSYWSSDQSAALAASGLLDKKKLETLGSKAKYTGETVPSIFKSQTGKQILNRLTYVKHSAEKKAEARRLMEDKVGDTYLDHLFTSREAYEILLAVYYTVTTDELLDFFEASTYPTKEEVKGMLELTFPGKERFFSGDFEAIKTMLETIMNPEKLPKWSPENPLSNTYMMKYFPGIHYNVVCRSVSSNCFLTFQRTLSGIQEAQRIGQNYPMTAIQDYDKIKASIEAIVNSSSSDFEKRRRLKTLLSKRATNIYLTKEEEKQALYDYLLEKQFLTKNTNREKPNSLVMKYYLMPQKYRLRTLGGTRKQKQKQKRKSTRRK